MKQEVRCLEAQCEKLKAQYEKAMKNGQRIVQLELENESLNTELRTKNH